MEYEYKGIEHTEDGVVVARPYMKARGDRYLNQPRLFEVELHLLNDKPINDNEDAAWEIIQGAFYNILFEDPHWHFFYEREFNLIRCSEEFYDEVITYLDECGVMYEEKGEWDDGSSTVNKYKPIYRQMFHEFSMMALEKYHYLDITNIFDRVAHCFLNHQYFTLGNYRKTQPKFWESEIIYRNAMCRSHYTGRCDGIWAMQAWNKEQNEKHKNEKKEIKEKKLDPIRGLIKKLFRL